MSTLCQLLENAMRNNGDGAAVITDDTVITYAELGRRARAAAAVLAALPADNPRIAMLDENGPDYVVTYWAILLARRTTVELNPMLGDSELRFQT